MPCVMARMVTNMRRCLYHRRDGSVSRAVVGVGLEWRMLLEAAGLVGTQNGSYHPWTVVSREEGSHERGLEAYGWFCRCGCLRSDLSRARLGSGSGRPTGSSCAGRRHAAGGARTTAIWCGSHIRGTSKLRSPSDVLCTADTCCATSIPRPSCYGGGRSCNYRGSTGRWPGSGRRKPTGNRRRKSNGSACTCDGSNSRGHRHTHDGSKAGSSRRDTERSGAVSYGYSA